MKEMSQTARDVLDEQIISNMKGKINYILISRIFLVDFVSSFELTSIPRISPSHQN